MSPADMPRVAAFADEIAVFKPRPWSKLRPEDRRRREALQKHLESLQRKRSLHVAARRMDGIVTDLDFKILAVRKLIDAGTRPDHAKGIHHVRWDD